ncbi:hypothetical protein [Flavobacterium tibetense]|uniref:DUF4382 domain-containing protein n=1 Tax=Flavobacterium tibetense TaxID=2233533 RepID=A0A365NZ95_9FLAO|nr:hypothetical protein [Flavobacterium tibetense]RBA27539.1 hypothetical protein DPN68_11710 [Flavobacterium tibetense]
MKLKILKSLLFCFFIIITSCSSDDSSNNSNQTISLKINGQTVTANVTQAYMNRAESIDRQTLFIEAENNQYKFNLKLIDNYNTNNSNMLTGDYNFENINTSTDYSEFFIYQKISGQFQLYHFPESSAYNVSFCNNNKISATFTAYLESIEGEDITVDGVLVPFIIEITDGQFTNISYTVNEL